MTDEEKFDLIKDHWSGFVRSLEEAGHTVEAIVLVVIVDGEISTVASAPGIDPVSILQAGIASILHPGLHLTGEA